LAYSRRLPDGVRSQCTVMTNRGFGILGDRLYMATLDMHLGRSSMPRRQRDLGCCVDDYQKGFSITHAPC
jgi:hypothetical protein